MIDPVSPPSRSPTLLVAHRAANEPLGDRTWAAGADVLELDVHLFRGRLEVRHAKAIWPSPYLFEKRRLLPQSSSRPSLDDVLAVIPEGRELWLDLKGPDPRLARRVLAAVEGRPHIWVSARSWWLLAPFHDRAGASTFRSVGTRWQRWLATRRLPARWGRGIVIHERLVDDVMRDVAPDTPVVVWAVLDLQRALDLVRGGVSGLILDDGALIDELRRLISAE